MAETSGDLEGAVDFLRKKGMAAASKKASRIAAEGLVGSYIHAGGKIGVMVEINCETDFVARTDAFQSFVTDLSEHLLSHRPDSLDVLMTQTWTDGNDVSTALHTMVVKTGENVQLRRFEIFESETFESETIIWWHGWGYGR